MRVLFAFVFLLICTGASAQWKTYKLTDQGDTLNRVDNAERKQGPWVLSVQPSHGEKGYEEQGYFEDDRKEGRWQRYNLQGDLLAIEEYRWGNKDGKNYYYNPYGALLREESWKAVNPASPYDTIPIFDLDDPTKIVARRVIKLEGSTMPHGKWIYYDADRGTVDHTEYYFNGKAGQMLNGELTPLVVSNNQEEVEDQTEKKAVAKPKEVLEFEKQNSGKKKVRVRTGTTGGGY